MDNNLDVTGLRTAAQTAGNDVTSLISQAPGMLGDLRKSLVSIYAKDNPLIQARDTALGNYLSAGDQARAEFLPKNQPLVAETPLNYSPTDLNAMVEGRKAAYLAPLLGYNQAVSQGYGNIGDILNAANTAYGYQVKAAESKASNAYNIYKAAIDEYNAITQRQNAGWGAGFGTFGIGGGGINNRPPIESFDQPDNPTGVNINQNTPGLTFGTPSTPISIPGQEGTIEPYTPASTNFSWPILSGIADWWNRPIPPQPTGTGLNLLGMGGSTGPFRQ